MSYFRLFIVIHLRTTNFFLIVFSSKLYYFVLSCDWLVFVWLPVEWIRTEIYERTKNHCTVYESVSDKKFLDTQLNTILHIFIRIAWNFGRFALQFSLSFLLHGNHTITWENNKCYTNSIKIIVLIRAHTITTHK